jgi:adenylate cyclase
MEYETTSTAAGFLMSHDAPPIAAPLIADSPPSALPGERRTFDDALGRRIVDLHIWAVHEGLRGATAYELFDGFCQRLVAAGVPLWRGYAGTQTIHPQWTGYGYLWRRDLNAIQPRPFVRGGLAEPDWLDSPFRHLVDRANGGERNPTMRRRLEAGPEEHDFPVLRDFAATGATDYVGRLFSFGAVGDRSHGTGIAYSFTTDRAGGFSDDAVTLLDAVLPALSLAMKAHAGHVIASGLLQAYLGEDAGRRVHAGAVERGSVEQMRAVLWYADIRGFTATADAAPGLTVIELLDDIFETLTATLRPRGGQVLKFLGDGMLATFAFDEADRVETCRRALDAAAEAMQALDALNATRAAAGKPVAAVDLALHLGEVLYGNVGAADRIDFTIIGPAVNEVARIEALCETLGRKVLVSSALAAASEGSSARLEPLGHHVLRGVRESREIFALAL